MVLNTRNFILYLLSVGFLLIAIVSTVQVKKAGLTEDVNHLASVSNADSDTVYTAEAVLDTGLNRSEKIESLKNKIAGFVGLGQDSAKPEAEGEVDSVVVEVEVEEELTKPKLCQTYKVYTENWIAHDVNFKVVEGARLVYRELAVPNPEVEPNLSHQEILLQLPLRTAPTGGAVCLPSDVVGIASDGSLIRNNEIALYSIFSSETLVGYTLDGFPIYGTNPTIKTDVCGGYSDAFGQYGYYLKKDSKHILNCFDSEPVKL